jgi:hypothetical protein
VAWNADRSKPVYSYKPTSSNTTLRRHIDNCHLLEYVTEAERNKWNIFVPSVVKAQRWGYSITEIKAFIEAGGDISCLPNRHFMTKESNPGEDLTGRVSIPAFTMPGLYEHLVAFIVANDQVNARYTLMLIRQDFDCRVL